MAPHEIQLVSLTPDRIAQGLALSSEAGWNQVEEDWRFMLGAGRSFGFVEDDGTLVASGLTVEFPDYAWISMILVTPRWRRLGLATRLMRHCVGTLLERGLIPALDASQGGREVYLRLGFRDVGTSTRLAGDLRGIPDSSAGGIAPISAADLPEIIAYDARSSGTDRGALLRHLRQRLPNAGFAARRDGRLAGYVMARNGRLSAQIGPLVADDDEVATMLLGQAGRATGHRVCLDLLDDRAAIRTRLDRAGFAPVTCFTRMVHGGAEIFPHGHHVHAIAGPELS